MLPAINTGFAFLYQFPNIVNIYLKPNTMEFKTAVVKDCRINYAPQQNPAFFKDNNPAQIELTLVLEEIQLLQQSDYSPAQALPP